MKIGIIIGVVIAIVALVVCLVPLKTVAYTVMVDYEDTETYYEDEPYEDIETYVGAVPLDYEVVNSFVREDDGHPCTYVEVKNTDDVSGTFLVLFDFTKYELYFDRGNVKRLIRPIFPSPARFLDLDPGQSKTALVCQNIIDMYGDDWSWNYTVRPSTKEALVERTVTKYRQVEKQRTVTKQRQETRYKKVTLLDYLLHYSEE